MPNDLIFSPTAPHPKEWLRQRALPCGGMNCDISIVNLCCWQFRYQTEIALWKNHVIVRFVSSGQRAYIVLFDKNDISSAIGRLLDECQAKGEPLRLMGVCEDMLPLLENEFPGRFSFDYDRDYCDYIYRRDALATLVGKKLQPKRNFVNRFLKNYPDYIFRPLEKEDFPACMALDDQWTHRNASDSTDDDELAERQAIAYVFRHWDELEACGGVLYVGHRLVAFTYGAPINEQVFDVCVEKANPFYEGAYAMINKSFATSLPEHYELLNREEDMGLEGLRKAKLSYHPEILLKKYIVTEK